jgi:protein-S-isoprenylcysteine O-methyltransferase Ste14
LVWLVLAVRTKRTIRRQPGSLVVAFFVLIFVIATDRLSQSSWIHHHWWLPSALVAGSCVAGTIAGATVAIWARLTIGTNWSGAVTLKEDHELIRRGPYGYVRHPIYSGLLVMGLASAIDYDQTYGFLLFTLVLILFIVKMRMEEKLMTQQFPSQYEEYRRQVKALIPFIV